MSTVQPTGRVTAAAAPAERHKSRWEEQLLTGSRGPALALLVLCVALTIYSPFFLTKDNLLNVIDQVTVLGVLALGMTAVIIIGGIDLSVGSVLALAMMVLGWLSHAGGLPVTLAVLGALAAGAAAGAVNGVLTTKAKLPAFIATLAMLSVARGLANVITDGQQIVGFPDAFTSLASSRLLGWVSATVALLIVLYVAGWAFLRYRANGRALYALGGSAEVARLAGLRTTRLTIAVYTVTGLLAGVAAVILAMRLDSAQPSAATGYELDTIAAVVIGGASLSGGVGSVTGTALGVLIIGVLRNGLSLMSVSPFVQMVVIGVVIALAVMLDVLRRKEA
ncbi:MAG TPA: ABC transporter permease [Solirubrobacter sp.]|nr:ABC transporter permease [Solirubrobacter sp.]